MDYTDLNPEQLKAVTSTSQDVLVLAGAGTGKTRVLTKRVEHLLSKGINPNDILCFTFTNKAAREMKWRISKTINNPLITDKLIISTFHSFFLPLLIPELEKFGFIDPKIKIYSDNDIMIIINQIIDELKPNFTNQDLRKYISNIKNEVALNLESIEQEAQVLKCFKTYQNALKERNAIDLDDILYYFKLALNDDLFKERLSFKYIMVDECQDTNPVQYEIIKALRGKDNNVFMCGDDDQSIYAFRGADPFLIKRYKDDFHPEEIILTKNYRNTKRILSSSLNLISNNNHRVIKNYSSVRKMDAVLEVISCNSNRQEGLQIASIIKQFHQHGYNYKDIAVLFRNHNIVEHLEPYLLYAGIPHNKTLGMNFLESEEIKTIINYYRLLDNEYDDIALTNLFKSSLFGFTNAFYLKVKEDSKTLNVPLFDAFKFKDEQDPKVKYFLDIYYNLKEEFNYQQVLPFYEKLVNDIGIYDYYLQKENAEDYIYKIDNFKEFLQDLDNTNPKSSIIYTINNIMLDNIKEENSQDKVNFLTIHQSKGLEFSIVIIPGMEEGILPSSRAKTPLEIEEERRICYVALTRAKDNCIFLTNKKRFLYGKERKQKESRFLNELIKEQ